VKIAVLSKGRANLQFYCAAAHAKRRRGRCTSSTIAGDDHPQAARRAATHNQRIQQSIPPASKLAYGIAADPLRLAEAEENASGLCDHTIGVLSC
jgi:hypothetical protein